MIWQKVYCFCFPRKGKEECKVNFGTTFQVFVLVCFKTRKVEKIMWFYLFKWKHRAFDFITPTKAALYIQHSKRAYNTKLLLYWDNQQREKWKLNILNSKVGLEPTVIQTILVKPTYNGKML